MRFLLIELDGRAHIETFEDLETALFEGNFFRFIDRIIW